MAAAHPRRHSSISVEKSSLPPNSSNPEGREGGRKAVLTVHCMLKVSEPGQSAWADRQEVSSYTRGSCSPSGVALGLLTIEGTMIPIYVHTEDKYFY